MPESGPSTAGPAPGAAFGPAAVSRAAFAADLAEHVGACEAERARLRAAREAQVRALYPHSRTFVLKYAEAIVGARSADDEAPGTLTLVTPDHDAPEHDHLYVGALPVLSRNLCWNKDFNELSFAASDGARPVRGHLRLTHSRLRAFGVVELGGRAHSVEYTVKPQSYDVKLAKDAAYLAGENATVTWDAGSARWLDADWSGQPLLRFTYGVNGEESIGGVTYTFVGSFQDLATGRVWDPRSSAYSGLLTTERRLTFNMVSGERVPTGPGAEYFPYRLAARLTEFAVDFTGGMVVGAPGYDGTPYGVIGAWVRPGAGLYRLDGPEHSTLIGVHDGVLHVGTRPVPGARTEGGTLAWSGLPADLAGQSGLPADGSFTFSPDGARITGSSFGATGHRISPDEALGAADAAPAALRAALRAPGPGVQYGITELLQMTQYAVVDESKYDAVQQETMDDYFTIVQNYMDQDLRKQFFSQGPPPPLDPALAAIARTRGTRGTDPLPWYKSLSIPYTASALAQYSPDAGAELLNGRRAQEFLTAATAGGDVMAAQGPLLYQRRYMQRNKLLDWFLLDQQQNAEAYAVQIDKYVEQWIVDVGATSSGTSEQFEALARRMRDLGDYAKEQRQFWAFALYANAASAGYLNMMQVLLLIENDVVPEEYTTRVQRSVAVMNALDPSSRFSREYAETMQYFQLSSILPQVFDFSAEFEGFNTAMRELIDAFIAKNIKSTAPALKEAAELLAQHATDEFIQRILTILHTSAAVGHGLNDWAELAATFDNAVAKAFGRLPSIVSHAVASLATGAMMVFFGLGLVDWSDLKAYEQGLVVAGGVNLASQVVVFITRDVATFATIWQPEKKLFQNLKMFFDKEQVAAGMKKAEGGLRAWLASNETVLERSPKSLRQAFAARSLFIQGEKDMSAGRTALTRIFGRNLGQFVARALGAAFSIVGIVMVSIELAESDGPLELSADILFLAASTLELVAIVGGWALAGSAITVGGLYVTTILSMASIVGMVAAVAGVVLLIILMTQPEKSPVTQFAERSGIFYMPYKTAVDYFEVYEPLGQPQRAGVALFAGADPAQALWITSEGEARTGAYDATGHTAFYLSLDGSGRARIAAPIANAKRVPVLWALAVDDAGAVLAVDAADDDASTDLRQYWHAEIVGEGTFETGDPGARELRSAPFKLYTAFGEGSGPRRYLEPDAGGWRLRDGDGPVLTLSMQVTSPGEVTMNDVQWYTVQHDQAAAPVLQVPGSLPRTWTVEPALPTGLRLDASTGVVSMSVGQDIPAAPTGTYKLTCTNPVGSASVDFDLAVLVPSDGTGAA